MPAKARKSKAARKGSSGPPEVLLRTSERSSFKRCRWQWERAFVDKYKEKKEAPALRFGSLVHAAMEKRYPPGLKRGPHPAKTFERLYAKELEKQEAFGFKDEDGTWHDALELGVDMLKGYVELYGRDEEWRVLASEQAFQVPVFDEYGDYVITYVGVVDGLWQNRTDHGVWIRDYKTCQAISVEHLALDDQMSSYWTFVPEWLRAQGKLKPNQELRGLVVDFLKKSKGDTRPRNEAGHSLNKDGSVSLNQPTKRYHREPLLRGEAESEALLGRVIQEAREMELVRTGALAAYKNPGGAPPLNNCRFCGYRDICQLHESGADWDLLRRTTMKTWDPYAEHELYDRA